MFVLNLNVLNAREYSSLTNFLMLFVSFKHLNSLLHLLHSFLSVYSDWWNLIIKTKRATAWGVAFEGRLSFCFFSYSVVKFNAFKRLRVYRSFCRVVCFLEEIKWLTSLFNIFLWIQICWIEINIYTAWIVRLKE